MISAPFSNESFSSEEARSCSTQTDKLRFLESELRRLEYLEALEGASGARERDLDSASIGEAGLETRIDRVAQGIDADIGQPLDLCFQAVAALNSRLAELEGAERKVSRDAGSQDGLELLTMHHLDEDLNSGPAGLESKTPSRKEPPVRVSPPQCSEKISDRYAERQRQTAERMEQKRRSQESMELAECTFKPVRISSPVPSRVAAAGSQMMGEPLQSSEDKVWERLRAPIHKTRRRSLSQFAPAASPSELSGKTRLMPADLQASVERLRSPMRRRARGAKEEEDMQARPAGGRGLEEDGRKDGGHGVKPAGDGNGGKHHPASAESTPQLAYGEQVSRDREERTAHEHATLPSRRLAARLGASRKMPSHGTQTPAYLEPYLALPAAGPHGDDAAAAAVSSISAVTLGADALVCGQRHVARKITAEGVEKEGGMEQQGPGGELELAASHSAVAAPCQCVSCHSLVSISDTSVSSSSEEKERGESEAAVDKGATGHAPLRGESSGGESSEQSSVQEDTEEEKNKLVAREEEEKKEEGKEKEEDAAAAFTFDVDSETLEAALCFIMCLHQELNAQYGEPVVAAALAVAPAPAAVALPVAGQPREEAGEAGGPEGVWQPDGEVASDDALASRDAGERVHVADGEQEEEQGERVQAGGLVDAPPDEDGRLGGGLGKDGEGRWLSGPLDKLEQAQLFQLMLFADYMEVDALLSAAAHALALDMFGAAAEGQGQAGASFSSEDLALLAQLPPQVSLRFAQACPWPIAAEILGSALTEHWLEDELLISNAAWLADLLRELELASACTALEPCQPQPQPHQAAPVPFLHPVAEQLLILAASGRRVCSDASHGDGWRLLGAVVEAEREDKRARGGGMELLEALLASGSDLGPRSVFALSLLLPLSKTSPNPWGKAKTGGGVAHGAVSGGGRPGREQEALEALPGGEPAHGGADVVLRSWRSLGDMWARKYRQERLEEKEVEDRGDMLFLAMCEPPLPEALESLAYLDKEKCEALPEHLELLYDLFAWLHALPELRQCILELVFATSRPPWPKEGRISVDRDEVDTHSVSDCGRACADRGGAADEVPSAEKAGDDGMVARGIAATAVCRGVGSPGASGADEACRGDGEQDKTSKEAADRDGMRMAAGSADHDRPDAWEAGEEESGPRLGAADVSHERQSSPSRLKILAREARETAAKLQPAHYRTRNDFATQPRSRRQLAREAAAAAALAAGAGCERARKVAVDAEMVATAQVAALQAFGAPCAVDVVVEGLLRSKCMMGMRRLQLEGCSSLAACALRRACDRFCMLTHLDVKGAVQVDDAALKHIASVCQRLELLQVGGCTSITDEGVVAFCEEVKRLVPAPTRDNLLPDAALVKLSLMNCSQLTNKSLCGVAELLPQELIPNRRMGGSAEAPGAGRLPAIEAHNGGAWQLRDLCIYGCYRMNDDALIRFKRTSSLSKLNTSGCYKITDMSLRYLMQIRPTLLVYHKHREFYKPLTERDLR